MSEQGKDRATSAESVSIYVHGENLDPEQVTKALQVQPTTSRRKGDTRTLKSGHVVVAKKGLWVLSIEANGGDVGKLLDQLMTALGDYGSAITAVPGIDDAYVDIFAAASGPYRFEISPFSADAIGRSGLSVQVTFSPGDD
jgi:hypothetical protein